MILINIVKRLQLWFRALRCQARHHASTLFATLCCYYTFVTLLLMFDISRPASDLIEKSNECDKLLILFHKYPKYEIDKFFDLLLRERQEKQTI